MLWTDRAATTTMMAATARPAAPAIYGQGRRNSGFPGLIGAGLRVAPAGAGEVGCVVLIGATPPLSCLAVLRAASAAAWLSCPRRSSLTAALTAASWIGSLPPISRRTQLAQNFRA